MTDLTVGSVFAGYRIDAVAGRGGMGVVYRATQLALERTVALKVVKPELAGDAGFRLRFERESKIAASLKHANVVAIHDARDVDGTYFLVMDYVDGMDLGELLLRDGALDPLRAADILAQVASALDAAHGRGLVHRDIKPGNVLVEARPHGEHAYLTDFGLSKAAGSDSNLTKTGMWVGTLDYIAPEQIQAHDVDARADVYALGCLLFHLLTARPPFQRDTDVAKLWAHMNDEPPPASEIAESVPPVFDAVIARAMAKDPTDRYAGAGQLGQAAAVAAHGASTSGYRVTETPAPTEPAPPAPATELPAQPETEGALDEPHTLPGETVMGSGPGAPIERPPTQAPEETVRPPPTHAPEIGATHAAHHQVTAAGRPSRVVQPTPAAPPTRRVVRRRRQVAVAAALAITAAVAGAAALALSGGGGEDSAGGADDAATAAPVLTSEQLVNRVTRGTMRVSSHIAGETVPGTGILVDADRRLVLTASHVVSGASSYDVRYGDTEIHATLHANAPCDDLALLQLVDKPTGLRELPIQGSDALKPGDRVLAAGFGNSPKAQKPESRFGAVTAANVPTEGNTSLPRFPKAVEHNAVVKLGDSGGPLLDVSGRVVGINNFFVATPGSSRDRYFAMSASRAKQLLPGLTAGRSRSDLGWKLKADTRARIREVLKWDIGEDWTAAVVVAGVTPGSPADKAGLSIADVVVQMGGEPTESMGDVCRILAGESGSSISVLAGSADRPKGWPTKMQVP